MKKQLLLMIALLCSTLSFAQEITFTQTDLDYGTIVQGSDGHRIFHFTNTGDVPLVISSAKGSCSCTVPNYPKEPIPPGAKGEIKVKYDTKRVGLFSKYITLTTNDTKNITTRLKIHGTVEAKTSAAPMKEKTLLSE